MMGRERDEEQDENRKQDEATMTSKKRKGEDPGDSAGSGGDIVGSSGGTAKAFSRGVHRGSGNTSEFMAGRRSMAYELKDAGLLSSGKLSTEILFLLPDAFVEFYAALFHQALNTGDSSVMHGRAGGLGKSKGHTGMALGSDTKLQAQPGGKRWTNPSTGGIASEKALAVKAQLDRGLMELVREAQDTLSRMRREAAVFADTQVSRGTGDTAPQVSSALQSGTGPIRCQGLRRSWVDKGNGEAIDRPKCGLFLKATWNFCPSCGTRTKK